ncbi:MAG: triose-phosphate isomerase [Candidatus Sungbacteria bacterium]|nr:triose-phosphate isomerase [Candidatus Sungbacteria bacterium]
MPRPLIIANWKMNPDAPGRAAALARNIAAKVAPNRNKVELAMAPPFPFLMAVRDAAPTLRLAAQDVFWEDIGPFTGEVSWHQLRHLKVRYVIIGHSERRIHLGESDEMVNKKLRAAVAGGLTAVLCVGERECQGGDISEVVGEQLERALKGVKKNEMTRVVIAYEPVWAISTMPNSRPDTPENTFRANVYIRKIVSRLFSRSVGESMRVIYGGSVSAKNIRSFLTDGHMQGALIGGASLNVEEFARIIEASA